MKAGFNTTKWFDVSKTGALRLFLRMALAAAVVLPAGALAAEGEPYFKILTPDTGEVLEVGSTYHITWIDSNVADADLEYSTDNGKTWWRITVSNSIDTTYESWRNYPWQVPNEPSTQCIVRIHEYYYETDEVFDSGVFEIRAASGITHGRLSTMPHGSPALHFDPFSRTITLRSGQGYVESSVLRLHSLSGASVVAVPHATSSAGGVLSWKVPDLAQGTYLLDWRDGSTRLQGRMTLK